MHHRLRAKNKFHKICPQVFTIVAKKNLRILMFMFDVSLQTNQLCSLIITTVAKISDTFMNRFFMSLQMTLCGCLIITTVAKISDTFMNEFFVSL